MRRIDLPGDTSWSRAVVRYAARRRGCALRIDTRVRFRKYRFLAILIRDSPIELMLSLYFTQDFADIASKVSISLITKVLFQTMVSGTGV